MRRLVYLALLALSSVVTWAAAEYPNMGPDIFDPHEKGEKLIAAGLSKAAQEHKRVLLLFGANWCPWCRRLHRAVESDPNVRSRVQKNFILVFVDANTRNDKKRNADVVAHYGNPLQFGLPIFVVLDAGGKQLATQETSSLDGATDAEVAGKVAAFLDRWAG